MSELHPFTVTSPVGRAFWANCAERRFSLPRCLGCGRLRWYLLPACPHCYTAQYDWQTLSGAATLYTYTIVRRSFHPRFDAQIPYVPAFVSPIEDPSIRFVTRIVEAEPEQLRVGADVKVAFTEMDGVLMPFFKPAQ